MELRVLRLASTVPVAVDSVLLVGLLLTTITPPSTPAASGSWSPAASSVTSNGTGANLTLDPSSYEMPSGANLSLRAAWSPDSPLCRANSLWFSWSVEGNGSATGILNATVGPSTTFFADSFTSGEVGVRVRSGATLNCSGIESVIERESRASISIITPLVISGIELGPNPLPPGSPANLRGTVVGGQPPYSVTVQWGDGTRTSVTLTVPGNFSAVHRFPAGEYAPSVLVGDSVGDRANASVNEVLSVGNALEVAIAPASSVAEVDQWAEFTGIVLGQTPGMILFFGCSNSSIVTLPTVAPVTDATPFSCLFTTPGRADVLFGAYPAQPGGPSASVVLYEPVVALPAISVVPSAPVGESGGTELLMTRVAGGALPVSLAWSISGDGSSGSETIWSDGIGVVRFALGPAGEYGVGMVATDSLGGLGSNLTATVEVDPALQAVADGASSLRADGALITVSGAALAGCPPFTWWVVPQFVPSNGSAGNGALGAIGEFVWTGVYALEGALSVEAVVADACGGAWQTTFVAALVPPLWASVTAGPGSDPSNESIALNLSIRGGLPPFRLEARASDGESWNATSLADGPFRWQFPANANGTIALAISLADGLGSTLWSNLSVTLVPPSGRSFPPPSTNPPTSPVVDTSGNSTGSAGLDPTWLLAGLSIPLGGAVPFVLVLRRRARRKQDASPGPDPVATLRRLIEPADGAERFTVELLAEEAGIPLTVVRSTIDRLVADGAVHSESGADGEEVLSWSVERGH